MILRRSISDQGVLRKSIVRAQESVGLQNSNDAIKNVAWTVQMNKCARARKIFIKSILQYDWIGNLKPQYGRNNRCSKVILCSEHSMFAEINRKVSSRVAAVPVRYGVG